MPLPSSDNDLAPVTAARTALAGWATGSVLTSDALARRAGMAMPGAQALLARLSAAGLVAREDGTTYRRTSRTTRLFVADLGGTKLNAAIADENGAMLAGRSEPTAAGGVDVVLDQIERLRAALCGELGLPHDGIAAAALGVPGSPHPHTGRIALAPNIPGLDGVDLASTLGRRLGVGVRVENDVSMAAIGELSAGAALGARNFAVVALGTGIGMGLVLDGRLVRGATGMAGEIALLPLGADDTDAASYRHGPLETAIGSGGMLDAARRHGVERIASVQDLFAAARAGCAAANAALDETARTLFSALLAVRAIVDPELVVLTGGIGLQPEIGRRLVALSSGHPYAPRVVTSTLGADAMLLGAAHAALLELLSAGEAVS